MTPRPLRSSLICLALGLGALSACGGDDAEEPAATTSAEATADAEADAATTTGAGDEASAGADRDCRITTEQVSAAAGIEMEPMGEPCSWQAPGLETSLFEVYFSGTGPLHYEGADSEVLDIGDGAKWDLTGTLIVEYRGTYLMIQVLNMGGAAPADPQAVAAELAQADIDSY